MYIGFYLLQLMESKKSIGIWIRVSTEDQVKGESPEHHEKRARLYAEAKGWEVEKVYRLDAVSGKSVKEHPETQRMLLDITKGNITGLIFSKLARLARNTKELLEFADIFRDYNADLISLQESIDTSTPAGRLFYTMIAAMAQWEREEISERVAASVPIRAQLGKSTGGAAPYGYTWIDNKMELDPNEAPVRKLMYEIFRTTKRKKATARELNERGYRTRAGKLFTGLSITRLIKDPTAKGVRIANYSKKAASSGLIYKPKDEWVVVPCPQLVEESLWDECNRIMDKQLEKYQAAGPPAVHLFAGYLTCACGNKMYVYHQTTYFCRNCKNKILVEDIETIYHEQLKTFLLSDIDLDTYINNADNELKQKKWLIESLQEKIKEHRIHMDELVAMRINRELTPESFQAHYKPLEKRVAQLEGQIPELEADIAYRKVELQSSETVFYEARNLYEKWQDLPASEKRSIIETITESLVIDKEDITIRLSYLPHTHPLSNGVKRVQTPCY